MGQAAVLPDPLEETTPPIGNADDLLSQLAGEEIDRLLSENDAADTEPASAESGAPEDAPKAESAGVDLAALAEQVEQETSDPAPPTVDAAAPGEPQSARPAANVVPVSAIAARLDAYAAEEVLPLYLRPLEWLNAPLTWLPEGVRDALGKVALVTLVNAVAVLLYVILFRR